MNQYLITSMFNDERINKLLSETVEYQAMFGCEDSIVEDHINSVLRFWSYSPAKMSRQIQLGLEFYQDEYDYASS